jgi:predicted acetyltransferase
MARTSLRLRPPRPDDESVVRAAHAEFLTEDFQFALGLEPDTPFEKWIARLDAHRCGRDLGDWVPGTFLLADVDGAVVGRVSVRHELNDWLASEGGHIGYGVLREHRRHGYATEILRQSLVVARAVGVDRVLVTCDDHNVGSAAVIATNCGVRDAERPLAGEAPMRRYWIE